MLEVLHAFQRIPLAHERTPLESMASLSRRLDASLYIKRDDCTGLASGGNKSRKLEYVLADALAHSADTIITVGGLQSNHARQTAAACARLGLRCILALKDSATVRHSGRDRGGNLLLDRLLGAEIRVVDADEDADLAMAAIAEEERRYGRTPYVVPLGASSAIGTLGYVRCAGEILSQMELLGARPTHVISAAGSGGTLAGLIVGFAALGAHDILTIGVDIDANPQRTRQRVADLVARCSALLGLGDIPAGRWSVLDGYAGQAYGEPTSGGNAAIGCVARCEGIILDPVYTGKAMHGLFAMLENGTLRDSHRIVFVHTGGLPILFAYGDCADAAT